MKNKAGLSLFFAGILPVIAFTVIEEKYGVLAGLLAGMVFGVGEIIYEFATERKVSTITWIGNGLLLTLGAVSLISSDGIWFKLQPALVEFGMFVFLLGSWVLKKPFMTLMIEKQNPDAPEFLKNSMSGITLRLSFFLLFHSILAAYAAFYWTTENWALLKGVGFTVTMILYMLIEVFLMRLKIKKG